MMDNANALFTMDEQPNGKPPTPKAKPPEKPLRRRTQTKAIASAPAPAPAPARTPKATPTAIMCELTRLKAQQKYLECHQVRLNASHFQDSPDDEPSSEGNGAQRPGSSSTTALASLINEIERLQFELDEKMQVYRSAKRNELQDMWHFVTAMKEDVFRPERLSMFTVNALRERIIGLNGQLERLSAKNSKELQTLREEYQQLERENKFIWRGSL
ncbi:uncharacterized protein LOC113565046 [Drosophila persimilis]|uniref:uncharacterized protein LOC113565046 n=1 Tax=Drosophila persimilis TaxID=7234 RepID=UPI000F0845B2|nr:uncharacterized protein LOC113565046 [Drosophila persimilis]